MKIGITIQNEEMTLIVVAYCETKRGNVALLINAIDAHYITVKDLTRRKNGTYFWYFGHYINDFEQAAKDYYERKNRILCWFTLTSFSNAYCSTSIVFGKLR